MMQFCELLLTLQENVGEDDTLFTKPVVGKESILFRWSKFTLKLSNSKGYRNFSLVI